MKKIITILAMSMLIRAFAQNPFPTNNAIWNESTFINDVKYEKLFGLLGDTIINEMLYSRLYELKDTILSKENIKTTAYSDGYIGGIRNEGEKVFFRPPYWFEGYYENDVYIEIALPDILLYDFGAEVGDIVWHNAMICSYGNGGYYDIQPHEQSYSIIDTITIENNRKIYHTRPGFRWYEGIGSYSGVLRSIRTAEPTDGNTYGYRLDCFKHNDTINYINSPCNKCFCHWLVSVSDIKLDTDINIFPNPTKNILNIDIPDNAEIQSLTIYSIDGKLIEKSIYSFHLGQLNISNLTTGSYIIAIETNKGNFNQIIIKN